MEIEEIPKVNEQEFNDSPANVKPKLVKVIEGLRKNRQMIGTRYDRKITVDSVSELACLRVFINEHELFGIAKIDGHAIRAFFHNYGRKYWEEALVDLID